MLVVAVGGGGGGTGLMAEGACNRENMAIIQGSYSNSHIKFKDFTSTFPGQNHTFQALLKQISL